MLRYNSLIIDISELNVSNIFFYIQKTRQTTYYIRPHPPGLVFGILVQVEDLTLSFHTRQVSKHLFFPGVQLWPSISNTYS